MSPSGSNSWCSIGDMKRILNSYDVLAAEVERLRQLIDSGVIACRMASMELGELEIRCEAAEAEVERLRALSKRMAVWVIDDETEDVPNSVYDAALAALRINW